jgi:glycerol uptake facilitator-like aquaporin
MGNLHHLGLGISLAVYLTAAVSGAHLNPAITIALWLFACFPARKVVPYIVAQVAGAFGGAAVAYLLYHSVFIEYETAHHIVKGSVESLQLAALFSTYPAAALSIWEAALVEIIITSILMCMIMALTDDGNGVPRGL